MRTRIITLMILMCLGVTGRTQLRPENHLILKTYGPQSADYQVTSTLKTKTLSLSAGFGGLLGERFQANGTDWGTYGSGLANSSLSGMLGFGSKFGSAYTPTNTWGKNGANLALDANFSLFKLSMAYTGYTDSWMSTFSGKVGITTLRGAFLGTGTKTDQMRFEMDTKF